MHSRYSNLFRAVLLLGLLLGDAPGASATCNGCAVRWVCGYNAKLKDGVICGWFECPCGDAASCTPEQKLLDAGFTKITCSTKSFDPSKLTRACDGDPLTRSVIFDPLSRVVSLQTHNPALRGPAGLERFDYAVGSTPIGVAVGDLNGDGRPDLVTAQVNANVVSVQLAIGAGGYEAPVTYPTAGRPWSADLGDLNRDGRLDVVVACESAPGYVSVILGNGDGTLATATNYPTGGNAHGVALADFNRDGKLDLVGCSYYANKAWFAAGDGLGWFAARADLPSGTGPGTLAVGDLNSDGRPDFATSNTSSTTVSVFTGDGAGGFSRTDWPAGANPSPVAIGDVNRDGRPDLVVGHSAPQTVSVLVGAGGGAFAAPVDWPAGGPPACVAVGDMNADGAPDIVVSSDSNDPEMSLSVLHNDGLGNFGAAARFPAGNYPISFRLADVNRDGRPDVVAANHIVNSLSVALNRETPGPVLTSQSLTDLSGLSAGYLLDVGGSFIMGNSLHELILVPGAVVKPDTFALEVALVDPESGALQSRTVTLIPLGPGTTQVAQPGAVRSTSLRGFPNPSRQEVSVQFTLSTPSRVKLEIVDVAGRLVRRFEHGMMPVGAQRVLWDGHDANGLAVPAGMYFAVLTTNGDRQASAPVAIIP